MAVTQKDPNTIAIAGNYVLVNDIPAAEAITPGMLITTKSDSGTLKWYKHDTAADVQEPIVALEQDEMNKTVDTAYAAGDLVKAANFSGGGIFWGLLPSGQNIAIGDYMQSNGDGQLKEATATTAAAGVAKFKARKAVGAITAQTRVYAEVLG